MNTPFIIKLVASKSLWTKPGLQEQAAGVRARGLSRRENELAFDESWPLSLRKKSRQVCFNHERAETFPEAHLRRIISSAGSDLDVFHARFIRSLRTAEDV